MSPVRQRCGRLEKGRAEMEMGWEKNFQWWAHQGESHTAGCLFTAPQKPGVYPQPREVQGDNRICRSWISPDGFRLLSLAPKWHIHLNCISSLTSLSVHTGQATQQKKPQGTQHFMIMQTSSGVVTAKTSLLTADAHLLKENRYPKCFVLC